MFLAGICPPLFANVSHHSTPPIAGSYSRHFAAVSVSVGTVVYGEQNSPANKRKQRALERTRTVDLLITSDQSGVARYCSGLQIPHILSTTPRGRGRALRSILPNQDKHP